MAEDDDEISKILKECTSSNVDYNSDNYNLNSILNENNDDLLISNLDNEEKKEENSISNVNEPKEEEQNKEIKKSDSINENQEEEKIIEPKNTQEEKLPTVEENLIKPQEENKEESQKVNKRKDTFENIGKISSDNLEDEINKILNEQTVDIPSITTSEIQNQIEDELKYKAEKEIEYELKNATKSLGIDKDEEIKKDIEKMLEEEKKKKLKEDDMKKKKEEEQKMLINFYPPFKNPLDFVQYLEVDRIMGQINNEMKNFVIQNQRKKDNKYDVSQISALSQINKSLSKFNINFISAKNTNLIVNTTDGKFLFYSIQSQKIIKMINPKKLQSFKVTCFDVCDDYAEMLVGYEDGTIALINIISEEVKYINNKLHKDSSLIELKIYKKEKNDLIFITSSNIGEVYLNTLKMIGFSSIFWRLNSVKIDLNNSSPIFLVKFIQFSMENQRLYSNLKQLKRYVMLGSLESISLYCIDPLEEIFEIKKPIFIKETVVPDAQIGIGRPPDVFMRFVKKDEKNHLLLIISWGKIIYFYQMPIIDSIYITSYKELGYYVNLFNILRIGFMNNSVIYCLDKSFAIKVLDSSKINPGKITIEKGQPVIPKNNHLAEIEKSRLVSASISSQTKIYGAKNNNPLETYLYSIVETEDSISSVVVLGERQIYLVNLVDWIFFLEYLYKKEDFISLFSVGIEIFKGKMMFFSNIPEERLKRIKVGDKLKQLVNQYVMLNTTDKKMNEFLLEENENKEKIGNSIKTAIEFCIEIEAFDYLVKQILPSLESKDYGDLFLLKLQPFILCDKIKNINISSDLISKLIDLYSKNDELDILSQMLLHININSIDTPEIKQKLEEMNLITPLIYLYMNGKNEDYYAPLDKMFDFFYSKALSNKSLLYQENDTIDYSHTLSQKLLQEKQIKQCKEYNGHKILWYIRWCLTGKKFPDNSIRMEKNQFDILVPRITYWLLSPKIIDEFLGFDAKNYFMIHKNIFAIPDLRKKIINAANNYKYSIAIINILSSSDVKIENTQPRSLVKYMVDWCKKKNEIKIYFYLYDFIIGFSNTDEIDIDKEFKKEAICFTLKNHKLVVKDKNNQEMNIMNNNLIKILNKDNFTEQDYKVVLDSIIDNNFNELKLFLFDKLDRFEDCLKLFLSDDLNISEHRDIKVFKWIQEKYDMFKDNKGKYKILIQTLEEHTLDLATLSIEKFFELSKLVFKEDFKHVVERLREDKKNQLIFIEYFIKYIINLYENNETLVPKEEFNDIKYILDRHISLLCESGQHDKIISALEECNFYPLDICLNYCEKAKAYEPCLYLYLKEGAFDKAFKMSTEKMDESLTNIINSINEEKDYENLLNDYNKYLNDIKKICENNNMHLEDLWFKILNIFYQYEEKVNELKTKNMFNLNKKNNTEKLYQIISNEIKELMEKMCSFVSVTKILNFVSEHNKNAGIKEFRELIMKLLSSYSNLTTILYSTKHLMTNAILKDEEDFQKLNLKGELLNASMCDLCKKPFKEIQGKKDSLMVFNCNHIFHRDCIVKNKNEKIECPLCMEIQFDSGVKGKSLINKSIFRIEEDNNDKNKFQVKVKGSAKKILQKLEKYDERSLEKHVLMINNSITVLSEQFRKEFQDFQ